MRPCLGTWLVVAMVCVAGAAGCTSWKKQTATADVLLRPPDPPRELCVTLVDGSRLALRSPVIRGDSVVGRPGYVQQITKEDRSGWGNRTSTRTEPKVRAWSRADT